MTNLVQVANLSDIPEGHAIVVEVAFGTIVLFNSGGTIFAVDHACLRCASSLKQGVLCETELTCAVCGWRYDLVTGCVQNLSKLRLDSFEVEVEASKVMLGARFKANPQGS